MPKNRDEKINPLEWVEAYGDYLYSYGLSRINDKAVVEDLVQDTFLSALKKLSTFSH